MLQMFWYTDNETKSFGEAMNSDFEKKRKEVLFQLSKLKPQQKSKKVEPKCTVNISSGSAEEKKTVAIFGSKSLFTKGLADHLDNKFKVHLFTESVTTIDTCAENSIKHIILDIDEPTGLKPSLEVVSNIRSIQPETICICCTKDNTSKDSLIMIQKGAVVINKPVNMQELLKHLS
jgi:hypothetical protein